ncbi:response regulator transcription factor [Bacillus sp. AGMB 02131]|uniref:Response regulator transcription factor n=1 Tax=Peribacillus faecalis TaxID=2772559 RepID=A0A927CYW0_9BACI|nr:response regulator transcription factor [Peribacillus faecalis]MBD3108270.1 response regulator transcription factor [Peribacillus faecalis]
MKEALRGKNILVAENNPRIRNIIKIYLERAGFEFLEAQNGEEARASFLKYDPCFVIIDVKLPNSNGTNISDWIRNELNSNVPIILMGTNSSEAERIDWLNKGADDFLMKPFSPSELVARVEAVLRRTANRCSKVAFED